MTTFILVAVVLVAIAVLAVVVPLLRKPKQEGPTADSVALSLGVLREHLAELDHEFAAGHLSAEAYAQEKAEIERRALEDGRQGTAASVPGDARRTKLAVALGIAVPLLVGGLYVAQGSYQALDAKKLAAQPEGGHALTQQQIVSMVERLSERLLDNPNDGQGWQMLARSYGVLGRYNEAVAAYARAVGLLPPDAQMLADFADMLAMTQGRRLQGEPEKVVRQALEVDPRNVKALALSGTIAFERKDYPAAIGEWRKILEAVPEESNVAASIRSSIADAERLMGGGSAPVAAKAAAPGAAVSGSVSLDAALRQKVGPDDSVFVFAHAVSGPRMPLAILRKRVADLPFEFTLNDSMAMAPNLKLSQFDKVVVGARVSKSGDALPHSGDFEGLSEQTAPGARNLKVVIMTPVK